MNSSTIPTTSQYALEISLLRDRLEKLAMGEQLSYQELSTIAGIDVVRRRSVLASATRRLLREKNMVFESVRGEGMRRLNDDQIAASGIAVVKAIGRKARRGIKVLSAGEFDRMNPVARVQHSVGMSLLNTQQHITSDAVAKRIETAMPQHAKFLPLGDTLKSIAS